MQMIEVDAESDRILQAFRECVRRLAPPDGAICFEWLRPVYRELFGIDLHPSKLIALANRGLLRRNDSTRGGARRYYTSA
jgi:hypothetical protein